MRSDGDVCLCNRSFPLAKKLNVEFPTMHQSWYVDDVEEGARCALI
jgi:hypothetical protein